MSDAEGNPLPPVFQAELESVTALTTLLSAIYKKEYPHVVITAAPEYLKVTTQYHRMVMQGSAIIPKVNFKSFAVRQEIVQMTIDLGRLLICLSQGQNNPGEEHSNYSDPPNFSAREDVTLKLTIAEENSPLLIEIFDGDVTTNLTLNSLTNGFTLFDEVVERTSRLHLKSLTFAEMWYDFDPESDIFGVRIDKDHFLIFFDSNAGKSQIAIGEHTGARKPEDDPFEHEEVEYAYHGDGDHLIYTFRQSWIKETLPGLALSSLHTTITTSYSQVAICYEINANEQGDTCSIEYSLIPKHLEEDPLPSDLFSSHASSQLPHSDRLPTGADYTTVNDAVQRMNIDGQTSGDTTAETELRALRPNMRAFVTEGDSNDDEDDIYNIGDDLYSEIM